MVYDRSYDDRILSFEPSGALKAGALVMRDRETDSWWSIMTGSAIAGDLEGETLREIPVSTKTTWKRWRTRHPGTLVLSASGRTHIEEDIYAEYWTTAKTYRDMVPDDDRLAPKDGVFVFEVEGEPIVVPHSTIEGGRSLRPIPSQPERMVLLFREKGAPLLASTDAYWFPVEMFLDTTLRHAGDLRARLEGILQTSTEDRDAQVARIAGFDTFWYVWALQNPGSRVE